MSEHILSLSYGKDSLACLGAIKALGWPLGDAGWGCATEILARKTPYKRRERGGYQLHAKTKKTQHAQDLGQIWA